MPATESAKTVTDVSILALAVVIALTIIVAVSMTLIIRFLRGVVGEESTPAEGCGGSPAWFAARRRAVGG